jgi:hypothetical protein
MPLMTKRIAGIGAAIFLTSVALVALGQTPPPAKPGEVAKDRKELRDDRRDVRQDRKDLRDAVKAGDKEAAKDAREELKDDKKELKDDRRDVREERRDAIEELRKTRQERRKDRVKEIRQRWGDLADKPVAKAEAKVHARRMARLNHMRRLADKAGKAELVARVDKVIEREKGRHQAAVDKIKAEGAKP